MPDSRFYTALGPLTVAEIAAVTGASCADPSRLSRPLQAVAPLGRATVDELSFLSDRRYVSDLVATRAGAVFIAQGQAASAPTGCILLITSEPQVAYARAALALHRPIRHTPGAAAVHPDADIEDGAELGPGVVLGQRARVGAGTVIGANTVIGPGVQIGRNCRIGANVTIGFALIGDRVRIYANTAIGEEGFGVAGGRAGALDVPQLGRVILQDDVTIGANCAIDRGAFDDTIIGEQTKIDNLVQIAHNVQIGRNCILAAQTGLSGSTVVGDGAMFGGRAGVADHLTIGRGAKIAAAGAVLKSVPDGETWSGYPARPLRRFLREQAWVARQADRRNRGGANDE